MPVKAIKLHELRQIVGQYDCSIRKRTKEWEVVDLTAGKWICGFATISGRVVKVVYVRNFERLINRKRQEQGIAVKIAGQIHTQGEANE